LHMSWNVGQRGPAQKSVQPPPIRKTLSCHSATVPKKFCVCSFGVWKGADSARIPSERRGRSCETVIRGWGVTTLWWLEFLGGRAVIIEGESLAHARLLATVNGFGRASQFIDGYAIDAHLMDLIPADYIGRTLSRADANDLLQQLRLGRRAAQDSEAAQTSASAAALKRAGRSTARTRDSKSESVDATVRAHVESVSRGDQRLEVA
jgi:hypothetical protein